MRDVREMWITADLALAKELLRDDLFTTRDIRKVLLDLGLANFIARERAGRAVAAGCERGLLRRKLSGSEVMFQFA